MTGILIFSCSISSAILWSNSFPFCGLNLIGAWLPKSASHCLSISSALSSFSPASLSYSNLMISSYSSICLLRLSSSASPFSMMSFLSISYYLSNSIKACFNLACSASICLIFLACSSRWSLKSSLVWLSSAWFLSLSCLASINSLWRTCFLYL